MKEGEKMIEFLEAAAWFFIPGLGGAIIRKFIK